MNELNTIINSLSLSIDLISFPFTKEQSRLSTKDNETSRRIMGNYHILHAPCFPKSSPNTIDDILQQLYWEPVTSPYILLVYISVILFHENSKPMSQ